MPASKYKVKQFERGRESRWSIYIQNHVVRRKCEHADFALKQQNQFLQTIFPVESYTTVGSVLLTIPGNE